jgi:hypothetical protein
MSVSEPGGELREALQNIWVDWESDDPDGVMSFNDFLAPEIESALRVTFRYYIRKHMTAHHLEDQVSIDDLVESWVRNFATTLRDKRPQWRDWKP